MRENRGLVKNVVRALRGSLVALPIDPVHVQRYFGDLKGFGAVDELVMITGGVPGKAAVTDVDLERADRYGSHPCANEHLSTAWKKIGEDVS